MNVFKEIYSISQFHYPKKFIQCFKLFLAETGTGVVGTSVGTGDWELTVLVLSWLSPLSALVWLCGFLLGLIPLLCDLAWREY